jgi:hypothetical protein
MALLPALGIILLAGLIIWVIQQLPFIDASMKKLATILIVVVVAVWFITLLFGVNLGSIRIGR